MGVDILAAVMMGCCVENFQEIVLDLLWDGRRSLSFEEMMLGLLIDGFWSISKHEPSEYFDIITLLSFEHL